MSLSLPRICKKQIKRNNITITSVEDYFCIFVFVSFLDHLHVQLTECFFINSDILKSFMCLLPVPTKECSGVLEEHIEAVKALGKFCEEDIDCSTETLIRKLAVDVSHVAQICDQLRRF